MHSTTQDIIWRFTLAGCQQVMRSVKLDLAFLHFVFKLAHTARRTIMEALLTPLVGSRVKLGQRNGQDVVGVLINAKSDYATVFTDKGDLIHYPYTLIKSVTRSLKEAPRLSSIPDIAFPDTFKEVLSFMVMQMVEVENSEGVTRGVVFEVTQENVGIVSDMKFVYYPIDQIYSISPIYKLKSRHGKKEPNHKDSPKDRKPEKHPKRRSERDSQNDGRTDSQSASQTSNQQASEDDDSLSAPYYALVDEDDAYESDEDDTNERNRYDEPEDHQHETDEDDEPEADEEDLLEVDENIEPDTDEEDLPEADEDDEPESDEDNEPEVDEDDEPESDEGLFEAEEDDEPEVDEAPSQVDQLEANTDSDPIHETFFKKPATGESASLQPAQSTVVLPKSTGNPLEDPRDIYQKTLNSGLSDLFMWRNPVEKAQKVNEDQESATQNASERDSVRDTGRGSTDLSSEQEEEPRSTGRAPARGKERRTTDRNSGQKTERRSTGGDSRREADRRSAGRDAGRKSDRNTTGRGSERGTNQRSQGRDSGRGTNGRSSGKGTGGSSKGRSR
jgi:hypothetical protein